MDEGARGGHPGREIDRADDGLRRVREDRALVPATGRLFTAPEPKEVAKSQSPPDLGEGAGVDYGSAQLREVPLRLVGMTGIQRIRDDEPKHGVAKELEALIVRERAVLVRERAMRHR